MDVEMKMGIKEILWEIEVIIVMKMVNYERWRKVREKMMMEELFLMIVLLGKINEMMESFLLRRMEKVWIKIIIEILGIGMKEKVVIKKRYV